MNKVTKWIIKKLNLYTEEQYWNGLDMIQKQEQRIQVGIRDEIVAAQIKDIRATVDIHLKGVKEFDRLLLDYLHLNKVIIFQKNTKDKYTVSIIDDIGFLRNLTPLAENSGVTPQRALLELPELTDNDYVNELSLEFIDSFEGTLPADVLNSIRGNIVTSDLPSQEQADGME